MKPKKNAATFFSYYNPTDNKMDNGYSEHSGCPVLKGEKWISVAWMREGVTANRPWEIYDPSGVEILYTDQLEKKQNEDCSESVKETVEENIEEENGYCTEEDEEQEIEAAVNAVYKDQ